MRNIFPPLIGFALGLMLLALSSPAPAAPQCRWASDMSRAFCAPPFGGIVQDRNVTDKYYCGLGQCVITSSGKYRCSSISGGAAVIDSRNRAACVGGCTAASESLCVRPEP